MLNLLCITLFSLLMLSSLTPTTGDSCAPSRCGKGGPQIRFPFRIKDSSIHGSQSTSCGYPGFDLSCKGGNTYIHLPSNLKDDEQLLRVIYIDYKEQELNIIPDPQDCLVALLINNTIPNDNVTLSDASPFHYSSSSNNYTLITCSKNVDFRFQPSFSCLSDSTHEVFAARTNRDSLGWLPVSCQPGKTFIGSLYFHKPFDPDNYSVGIILSWNLPECYECEQSGGQCGLSTQSDALMCFYKKGSWRRNLTIIGASIGSMLILVIIFISTKVYGSSKVNKGLDLENEIMVQKFLEDYKSLNPTRYSYADLKRMTNQFNEKLGQGGFGTVFKGKLPNGTFVAVKILQSFGVDCKEFMNEVATMGRIHHVNVVRLLGFCSDRLKRALVYEFMPNESLEKFIFFRNNTERFLGWEKLQDIAIGIARGIEYLHQGCDQRILHFDIKPHNILLDKNFKPKISDFGMAKLCLKGQSVVSMTAARGTMGYIAPEVLSRNFGNVSYKSDVYSFGMLLLEMVGGRRNNDLIMGKTGPVYFPQWIYERICLEEDLCLNIITDEEAKIARKLIVVALWCIQWKPVDRPSMNSGVQMLEGSIEGLAMPPDPFVSTPTSVNVEKMPVTNLITIDE